MTSEGDGGDDTAQDDKSKETLLRVSVDRKVRVF
jgi:hypothetical protein